MAENPYIRIIKAAKEGVGVRITADECYYLAQDDSIVQVAAQTSNGEESNGGGFVVTKAGFVDTPSPQQNVRVTDLHVEAAKLALVKHSVLMPTDAAIRGMLAAAASLDMPRATTEGSDNG